MPTYDYRCKSCSHEFELFQSMSAKPEKKCPKCGKNTLERLIGTGAALLFKGSGFYQTDYRSESYKKAAGAEAKPATPPDSSNAKPVPEAKPADKPPAAKPEPAPKSQAAKNAKPTKKSKD